MVSSSPKKKKRKENEMVTVPVIILQQRLGHYFSTNNLDGWKILPGHIAEEQSNDTHVVVHASGAFPLKSEASG